MNALLEQFILEARELVNVASAKIEGAIGDAAVWG